MKSDFTPIGKALGNPARSAMLNALLDGTPSSASELARQAGVSASTASAHLAVLVRSGLVRAGRAGRQRQFVISNGDVAAALESVALICPQSQPRSLRQSIESEGLRIARTCYDHLAGRVGVRLLSRLTEGGWLRPVESGFELTSEGDQSLRGLGVGIDAARESRRAFARSCLDWTERRPHLAGGLGAALLDSFVQHGWIERQRGPRIVRVTPRGRASLVRIFSMDDQDLGDG